MPPKFQASKLLNSAALAKAERHLLHRYGKGTAQSGVKEQVIQNVLFTSTTRGGSIE